MGMWEVCGIVWRMTGQKISCLKDDYGDWFFLLEERFNKEIHKTFWIFCARLAVWN